MKSVWSMCLPFAFPFALLFLTGGEPISRSYVLYPVPPCVQTNTCHITFLVQAPLSSVPDTLWRNNQPPDTADADHLSRKLPSLTRMMLETGQGFLLASHLLPQEPGTSPLTLKIQTLLLDEGSSDTELVSFLKQKGTLQWTDIWIFSGKTDLLQTLIQMDSSRNWFFLVVRPFFPLPPDVVQHPNLFFVFPDVDRQVRFLAEHLPGPALLMSVDPPVPPGSRYFQAMERILARRNLLKGTVRIPPSRISRLPQILKPYLPEGPDADTLWILVPESRISPVVAILEQLGPLAEQHPLRVVGLSRWRLSPALVPERLHQTHTTLLSPFHTWKLREDTLLVRFLQAYVQEYHTLPEDPVWLFTGADLFRFLYQWLTGSSVYVRGWVLDFLPVPVWAPVPVDSGLPLDSFSTVAYWVNFSCHLLEFSRTGYHVKFSSHASCSHN